MAVTLYGTNDGYPSLHDELYYVATSTNATTSNFKYIFDIRIGGNLVSRLRIYPDPTTDKGIANVGNIVRNYWNSYFKPNATPSLISYNGNDNYVEYTIEVGEDNNGVVTPNLASGTFKAYNFVPPIFRDFAVSWYSQNVNRYMTNRDLTQLTYNGSESLFISFARLTSGSYTITVNNGITNATATETFNTFTLLDLSPTAINNRLGSSFITDATQRWTVTINGFTAVVNRVCDQHKKVLLHFLNDFGGYDTFAFRLVNREVRDMERKQYKQREWGLNGNYMQQYNGNNIMIGGNTQFAINQTVRFTLNSDYVNEQDFTWLRELISSPEVYMQQGGYYFPAIVTQNNWTEKIRRSDKLFNFSIGVDLMQTNSQYR